METTCKTCGKSIKRKPKDIRPTGNYCSRECYYKSGAPRPNRKTGITKTCPVCDSDFYVMNVHRNSTKYCSRKCKGIASRKPRVCPTCGKEFLRGGTGKYCSKPCAAIGRRSGEAHLCHTCNAPLYITKSRIGAPHYFCSRECQSKWQGRNKTSHTCTICGKAFRWSPSRSKAYNIKYCSVTCRDKDPACNARLLAMNRIQQQGKQTKPESIGYGILDTLDISYEPQHLIADKFCVDAFVSSLGIVVQFDGDYWHGHPERFPEPDHRQKRRMKLDISQDAYMRACGYSVIRIWETDLKKHPEEVTTRLRRLLAPPKYTPVVQV